jgi:hypothetical protein
VANFQPQSGALEKCAHQGVLFDGPDERPFRQAPARFWYISGIVLQPELAASRAIRVLISGGIRQWFETSAIAFPCQLLALSSSLEGEMLLTGFGFYCCQEARAMPDGNALFVLDLANREDFISVLQARGIYIV